MSSSSSIVLVLLLATALVVPSFAAKCTDKLPKTYSNCTALSALGAILHYTYDAVNGSISFAFVAKPAADGGWVSWGLNPTKPVMVGAQVFVAYVSSGVAKVKTYDLQSLSQVVAKEISYKNWDLSSNFSSGTGEITIFGTIAVPNTTINHIWQVGPTVTNDKIAGHAMKTENKASVATVTLVSATSSSTAPAPGPAGSNSTTPSGNGTTPSADAPAPSAGSKRMLDATMIPAAIVVLCGFLAF